MDDHQQQGKISEFGRNKLAKLKHRQEKGD